MIPTQQLLASRAKSNARAGGFTLMEVTMVLLIMGILAGFMMFAFDGLGRSEALNEAAAELEKLAHQSSRSATVLDQEFRIRFEPRRFYALEHAQDDFGVFREVHPDHTHEVSSSIKLQLRRWQAKGWTAPEKGEDWVFSPSGVSEPLSVRFSDGPAFIELDFSPLTGTVEERRSYIP